MIFHIVPFGEEHEESIHCPCKPSIEQSKSFKIIIHTSWEASPWEHHPLGNLKDLLDPNNIHLN
jgi:hypothetical protein